MNTYYKLPLRGFAFLSFFIFSVSPFVHAQQGMGVGNANPQEMLDVSGAIKLGTDIVNSNAAPTGGAGTIRFRAGTFQGWDGTSWIPLGGGADSDWTISGNDQYSAVSGNVGIGTSTPSELLHIKGTGSGEQLAGLFEYFIPGSGTGTTAGIKVTGRRGQATSDYAFLDLENNSTGNSIRIAANSDNNSKLRFYMHDGASLVERLTLESDGALTINNAFTLPVADGTSGQVLTTDGSGNASWATIANDGDWTVDGNDIYPAVSGNVGIGTTAPQDELHVEGSIRMVDGNQVAGYIPVSDANGTMTWTDPTTISTADDGDWSTSGTDIYNANTGNVGIGTSSPQAKLDITSTTSGDKLLRFDMPRAWSFVQHNDNVATALRLQAEINDKNFEIVSADGLNRAAFFKTHNSGSRVSFVPDGGRVGIGITNPWSIFHVVTSETGNVSKLHNPTLADGSLVGYEFGKNNSANNMAEFRYNHVSDGNTANWINLGLWGNANILNITGAGNVGIGTTTPGQKLHVAGRALVSSNGSVTSGIELIPMTSAFNSGGRMFFREDDASDVFGFSLGYSGLNAPNGILNWPTNSFNISRHNGNATGEVVLSVSRGTGNVGIGTTGASEKLEVAGKIRMVDGNQAAGYIPVSDANGTMSWTDPTTITTSADGDGDATNELQTLAQSGTDVTLSNGGGTISVADDDNDASNELQTLSVSGNQVTLSNGGGTVTVEDVDDDWTVDGNDIYPTVSGNVGIGTTTPAAELDVNGELRISELRSHGFATGSNVIQVRATTNSDQWIRFRRGGNPRGETGVIFSMFDNDHFFMNNVEDALAFSRSTENSATPDFANSNELMRLAANGNLGLGTAAPASKFHVEDNFTNNTSFVATIENTANGGYANGLKIQAGENTQTVNNRFISFARPDGSEIGAVRQITSNSVDYNTTSDLRLKTNIAPTTKGLNDLMQIEVKDYLYKDDPSKPQTGFIAQQVYEHYPNAVTPGGDDVKTDPWMMDYGKMSPLLVKAIQDQQEIIQNQQEMIESLQADVQSLKQKAKQN